MPGALFQVELNTRHYNAGCKHMQSSLDQIYYRFFLLYQDMSTYE